MRFWTALTTIVIGGLALDAAAACEQPPLVMIPAQEDIEGKQEQIAEQTREYFQGMQEYVNCIKEELTSAGENPPAIYRTVLVQRNNAAVAEAEAVQRWFTSRFPAAATVEAPPSED